jgi:hypothetical protein
MSTEPVSRINVSAESGVPEVIVGNETLTVLGETGSVIKTQVTATDSILIGFEPAVGGLIGSPLVAGDMVVESDGKYHAIPTVAGIGCPAKSMSRGSISAFSVVF